MTASFAAPPDTGGRAARFGLIRPADDRRIAGVGAALGSATGTDPLLWRVLLAVLTLFAGAGVVLYLVCWLLFPARGDQTSPLGSLLSSKKSSTSAFVTLLLGLAAILVSIITFITTNGRPFLVFGFIAALVVMLARRRVAEPAPAPVAESVTPAPPVADYTAPFAPHGPYANRTLDLPAEVPPPPPVPPVPPQPPRPPRSSLGLVTFSLVVIVIGLAAILDMVGVPVPMASTLAIALLICGGGLLLGTWWGRGRGLILLGVVLSLLLGAVTVVGRSLPTVPFTSQHTSAEAVDDIPDRLTATVGASVLDLSGVEFADGEEAEVDVDIWVGSGVIVVGENVDVVLDLDQRRGEVTVDGVDLTGPGQPRVHEYESLGPDGEGGGRLVVTAVVDTGSLEIER